MGTIHAKEMDPSVSAPQDQFVQKQVVQLDQVPARVHRIIVDGLGRTKNDVVIKEVKKIFGAGSFKEMLQRTQNVKRRLERLGLFKSITIAVDTVRDKTVAADSYEVTFEVSEIRRAVGGINTLIGTNDANLILGVKFPNVLGRGQKLAFEYSHGTKQNRGHSINVSTPFHGDPDKLINFGIYESYGEFPWSGYLETDRGMIFGFTIPSLLGSHRLSLEGIWRDLRAMSRTTSFTVREQAGHSLKTAFKHILERDTRDDAIMPKKGTLIRLINEYAGLGGNVEYLKNELEFQFSKSLVFDTAIQFSLAGGIMKPLTTNKEPMINDRFFLGGPLTLRGFNLKGVGPHSDGNALGANTYWVCALHLYSPLPFRPGKGGFGDLFATHLFVNAGNLANVQFCNSPYDIARNLTNSFRLAWGGGMVLRMGQVARLELNYVIPINISKGDSVNPGLQFGIGFAFL